MGLVGCTFCVFSALLLITSRTVRYPLNARAQNAVYIPHAAFFARIGNGLHDHALVVLEILVPDSMARCSALVTWRLSNAEQAGYLRFRSLRSASSSDSARLLPTVSIPSCQPSRAFRCTGPCACPVRQNAPPQNKVQGSRLPHTGNQNVGVCLGLIFTAHQTRHSCTSAAMAGSLCVRAAATSCRRSSAAAGCADTGDVLRPGTASSQFSGDLRPSKKKRLAAFSGFFSRSSRARRAGVCLPVAITTKALPEASHLPAAEAWNNQLGHTRMLSPSF